MPKKNVYTKMTWAIAIFFGAVLDNANSLSRMIRPSWKIVASAAMLMLWNATAHSQSPLEGVEAVNMEEIERFASVAQAGTDPRVTASSREQFAESGPGYRNLPAILVSIEGEPAFVYIKERWGSREDGFNEVITFVMRCRGSGVVDLSYEIYRSRPSFQPEQAVEFDNIVGQVAAFGRSVPAVMRLSPYGSDATYDMPVAVAFEYDQHGRTDDEGIAQIIHVQIVGAARSDDQFFRELRGTSNLAGQIMVDGQYKPMSSGIALDNLRSTGRPLLDHCSAGNDNPMDRDFNLMTDPSMVVARVEPPADLDLSFLDQSRSPYLQSIYQGVPPNVGAPLHLRLTIPLAYHAAYSSVCGAQLAADPDFVYTDIFGESQSLAVPSEDFASVLEATLIYEPVMRKIYDDNVSNDYSYRKVLDIYQRSMGEWKADWEAFLGRYGCTGEVNDQLRLNIKSNFPFVEYRQGSRNVLVDFGGRQYDIVLASPIDIETARQIGLAEAQPGNDGIFTSSYPGRLFRAIAVGNFAQVDAVNENFREVVSNPLGGDPDGFFSQAVRLVMEIESAVSRESGILTAYAIGRTYHLGSCGDVTTTYSQEKVYWTEYVNGFGQHVSSSPEWTRTTVAEVPVKFEAIVQASNSIETSWLLDLEMAQIIGRLSCDSPARQQLEDNMIAYFNRQPPVHIGPVPAY